MNILIHSVAGAGPEVCVECRGLKGGHLQAGESPPGCTCDVPGKGVTCDCRGWKDRMRARVTHRRPDTGTSTEHHAAFEECLAVLSLHVGRWELPEFTPFTPNLKAD